MDDVIFAGTAKRPALGRAEVALTIDNSAGLLPIDFTEVTITRTLFRTRRQRVRHQRRAVPAARHPGAALRHRRRPPAARHRLPGPDRRRPQRPPRGPPPHHRGGGRRPEVPQAQGEGGAPAGRHRGQPDPAAGPAARGAPPAAAARAPGRRRPSPRRRGGRAAGPAHATSPGRELTTLRRRLADGRRGPSRAGQRGGAPPQDAGRARHRGAGRRGRARSASGGDDLGDALVRFESLRERARGLAALLAERRRGIERERGAFVDQAVIASLEADAARLAASWRRSPPKRATLAPQAEELARAEASPVRRPRRLRGSLGRGVPAPSGRAAEVRGELAALRTGVERGEVELDRVHATASPRSTTSSRRRGRRGRPAPRARPPTPRPPRARWSSGSGRPRPRRAEAEIARRRRQRPRSERPRPTATPGRPAPRRWRLALDEARARAGAERLARSTGSSARCSTSSTSTTGGRRPFEAAAGEALAAVVVDGVDAARQALAALAGDDVGGAVLALGAARPSRPAPSAGEPVRRHVRSPRPDVEALLDALLGPPWWSTAAGRRPSTPRSPTPRPSSSPAPATASA